MALKACNPWRTGEVETEVLLGILTRQPITKESCKFIGRYFWSGEQLRKTPITDIWPPHMSTHRHAGAHAHVRTHLCTHTHRKAHTHTSITHPLARTHARTNTNAQNAHWHAHTKCTHISTWMYISHTCTLTHMQMHIHAKAYTHTNTWSKTSENVCTW